MTQTPPTPPTTVVIQQKSPGCLIQLLWFLFVGWWLGGIVITIAWFLNITIVGLPLGMHLLNNIPKTLALRNPTTQIKAVVRQGQTVVMQSERPQINFWIRAIYFVLIGWWWSGIWLALAYAACATIILMPIGFSMFDATPAMTTLRRY